MKRISVVFPDGNVKMVDVSLTATLRHLCRMFGAQVAVFGCRKHTVVIVGGEK